MKIICAKFYVSALFAVLLSGTCFGKYNSLISVNIAQHDTDKILKYLATADKLSYTSPDSAIIVSKQALALANAMPAGSGKKLAGGCLGQIGMYYYLKGDYDDAINYSLKALDISESVKDKKNMSAHLGMIGIIYKEKGIYTKALEYSLKALKISEETKSKYLTATWYNNIGLIYLDQKDFKRALDYHLRSLAIAEEIKDKILQSSNLGNIGIIYEDERNYEKALEYYFHSQKIEEETGNQNGISRNLHRIGNIYKVQKDLVKAEESYFKALKIAEEIGDKDHITMLTANIGSLFLLRKDHKTAETYFTRSMQIAEEIGSLDDIKVANLNLSELYETTNRPVEALKCYKAAMAIKDSMFNKEKNNELVRQEMNYDFAKKEALAKVEQDKKDLLAQEELKRQKDQRNYSIIGLVLFLFVAIFMFRSYRQKKKANELIALQKSEVERQKHIVEEKNQAIIDSITYAQRIQRSLMPNEKFIEKTINRLNGPEQK